MLLIVSPGPSVVPRLIGLPLPVAEKRLRDDGMKLRFRAVASDVTPGVVVATEPEPGEPVAPGATVTVSVSSGPGRLLRAEPALVPAGEARASVRNAGFVARVFEVPSTEPAGIVVAQSPQPGASSTEALASASTSRPAWPTTGASTNGRRAERRRA